MRNLKKNHTNEFIFKTEINSDGNIFFQQKIGWLTLPRWENQWRRSSSINRWECGYRGDQEELSFASSEAIRMLCLHKQIWSLGPTLTEVTDTVLPQFPLKKSNTTNLDPQRETCLVGHPSCMDMKTYRKSSYTRSGCRTVYPGDCAGQVLRQAALRLLPCPSAGAEFKLHYPAVLESLGQRTSAQDRLRKQKTQI